MESTAAATNPILQVVERRVLEENYVGRYIRFLAETNTVNKHQIKSNQMIETLVRLGSTAIDTPNNNGVTPLNTAADKDHVSAIEALVRLGSTAIDTPNSNGWTPLNTAAHKCHVSVIEALVRLGSTAIDTPNNHGVTPLYPAARNQHQSCAQTLVMLGADTNIPTNRLSDEMIEQLLAPIDEDEAAEVRYRVYFADSLVHRLLFPTVTQVRILQQAS